MAIRKTGAVTGQVTEVEQPREGLPPVTAAHQEAGSLTEAPWAPGDERALALENEAADQE